MEQNFNDIYDLIEHAIDNAFVGQMNLRLKVISQKNYCKFVNN